MVIINFIVIMTKTQKGKNISFDKKKTCMLAPWWSYKIWLLTMGRSHLGILKMHGEHFRQIDQVVKPFQNLETKCNVINHDVAKFIGVCYIMLALNKIMFPWRMRFKMHK
jgi:hypothetical protein